MAYKQKGGLHSASRNYICMHQHGQLTKTMLNKKTTTKNLLQKGIYHVKSFMENTKHIKYDILYRSIDMQ